MRVGEFDMAGVVVPLLLNPYGADDRIYLLSPGFEPGLPNGAFMASGPAWAARAAHNLASAYRPDVPR